jgi:O-antigen ligase
VKKLRAALSADELAYALLWLLVFTIPWDAVVQVEGVGTITRIVGLVFLPVGIYAVARSGRVRPPAKPHIAMTLMLCWGLLTYLWTVDPPLSRLRLGSSVQLYVMAMAIWQFAPSRARQDRLWQAFVLGTFVTVAGVLGSYWAGAEVVPGRFTAPGMELNRVAHLLALSIVASCYLTAVGRRGWTHWLYVLQVALALIAILLTGSRGAFVTALAALLFVPWTAASSFRKPKLRHVLSLAAVVCAVLLAAPSASWERIATIEKEIRGAGRYGVFSRRDLFWKAGIETFRERPWAGHGSGAFPTAAEFHLGERGDAHSTVMAVLVGEGLIGGGLWIGFLAILVSGANRLPGVERKFWLIALLVWFLSSLAIGFEREKAIWLLFGLLAARIAIRDSGASELLTPPPPKGGEGEIQAGRVQGATPGDEAVSRSLYQRVGRRCALPNAACLVLALRPAKQ